MPNPLLSQTQVNFGPQNGQLKQLYNLFNMARNPSDLINSSPQLQEVMRICNGRNPKDVFFSLCKERNVDPNLILDKLR